MPTDYDSDDVPSPLTDDSSARRIYVGERSRERRSLTRKTASLERFPREEEERYEQFTELSEHRDFFQRLDYNDRYRHIQIRKFCTFLEGLGKEYIYLLSRYFQLLFLICF